MESGSGGIGTGPGAVKPARRVFGPRRAAPGLGA